MYQLKAMWIQGTTQKDTLYQPMVLLSAEAFLDAQSTKKKERHFLPIWGFSIIFGTNYLKYNGIMNPENGINSTVGNVGKSNATCGNAYRLGKPTTVVNAGFNWLINGHKAKITLDWQNRRIYAESNGRVQHECSNFFFVLQYQVFI